MVALGGKTTEIWDKRFDHATWKALSDKAIRLRRAHGDQEVQPAAIPWPILCDDGRVLRVVDPIASTGASMEALQILKKKQYEDERRNSNGARIPRCPFKGAAGYGHKSGVQRRSRAFNRSFSPILFTIHNFLTPEDCERLITASELRSCRHQDLDSGGASGAFCFVSNQNYDDSIKMWTPGLKAVFEGIRIEGEEDAFAAGVSPYITVFRYENGGRREPEPFEPLYRNLSEISSSFYTFYGYSVLVYLNGSQVDADSHIGSSKDVVGGETHAFYSRQHVSGNSKQHIAKIAPEVGMAVCIARGQRSPLFEIRPVADGVLYMIEFYVDFSNFTQEDIVQY